MVFTLKSKNLLGENFFSFRFSTEKGDKNENGRVASFESLPTVIILNIGTDRSEQTVQTQIRLEESDQGLLCLLFCLHLLNTILHCKIQLFQLWDNYSNYFRCPNF